MNVINNDKPAGTADGSPRQDAPAGNAGDPQTDAESGFDTGGEPDPQGDPEGGDGGSRQDDDPRDTKIGELSQELDNHKALLGDLMRLPNWRAIRAQLEAVSRGEDPAAAAQASEPDFAEVDALAEEILGNRADLLKDFFRKTVQAAQAQALTKINPVVGALASSVADTKVQAAIQRAGLDPSVTSTRDYQAHVRSFRAKNPWIAHVERGDPAQAAGLFAEAYAKKAGISRRNGAQQARNDAARHSLEDRGSRGGPTRRAAGAVTVSAQGGTRAILDAIRKGASPDALAYAEPQRK